MTPTSRQENARTLVPIRPRSTCPTDARFLPTGDYRTDDACVRAPYKSAPDDLTLHGARVLGYATAARIANRFGLDLSVASDFLLDFEAHGWAARHSFAGSSGWSLTDAGRIENERRLSAELDKAHCRETVTNAHAAFVPLNHRLGAACTDWQIRPTRSDPALLGHGRFPCPPPS